MQASHLGWEGFEREEIPAQMMSHLGHSFELFKDVVDEHNPQSLEMLSTS